MEVLKKRGLKKDASPEEDDAGSLSESAQKARRCCQPSLGKLCFAEAVDKATGKKLKRRELKALSHLRSSESY